MEKMDETVCLDSDIIVSVLRGNEETKTLLETMNVKFCITVISVFEIWLGKESKNYLGQMLDTLETIPLESRASRLASEIYLELEKRGMQIELKDLFIGAICIANNVQLLTYNKKHFERLQEFGLRLARHD